LRSERSCPSASRTGLAIESVAQQPTRDPVSGGGFTGGVIFGERAGSDEGIHADWKDQVVSSVSQPLVKETQR